MQLGPTTTTTTTSLHHLAKKVGEKSEHLEIFKYLWIWVWLDTLKSSS
jgi:hypothetical protein